MKKPVVRNHGKRESMCVLWLLAECFCQSPNSGSYVVSDSCLLLELFLLGCLVQAQYKGSFLICFTVFFFAVVVVVVVKTIYLFI